MSFLAKILCSKLSRPAPTYLDTDDYAAARTRMSVIAQSTVDASGGLRVDRE